MCMHLMYPHHIFAHASVVTTQCIGGAICWYCSSITDSSCNKTTLTSNIFINNTAVGGAVLYEAGAASIAAFWLDLSDIPLTNNSASGYGNVTASIPAYIQPHLSGGTLQMPCLRISLVLSYYACHNHRTCCHEFFML